ncbi:methyltransferase type 11 [Chryseobacterium elymi]|uniref:Methyltransferase type 11 n=1 Tax=Chryseobacterium elymi TaxID=395936 RepID=A0A3D9DI16_9FLAO|nr:methyltransferase type 11 [Chryseobacterium elymi]
MIGKAVRQSDKPQTWADLGCGDGTFTNALAHLLPDGSHIYAVDSQSQNFSKSLGNNVSVNFIKADFEKFDFDFSNLDGILMANSLHYIKDKGPLINRLEKYLSADKKFVIIEYDTDIANQWVPYPILFFKLKELFTNLGYSKIIKVNEQQSIFGQGSIYSATIGVNH